MMRPDRMTSVTRYPFVLQSIESVVDSSHDCFCFGLFSKFLLPSVYNTFRIYIMLYRNIQTAPGVLELKTSFTLGLGWEHGSDPVVDVISGSTL
jgi:hypothetical protein